MGIQIAEMNSNVKNTTQINASGEGGGSDRSHGGGGSTLATKQELATFLSLFWRSNYINKHSPILRNKTHQDRATKQSS